ncbi:MAG: hypothetical protein JSU96_07945, partial [Acidobacteriota bacterium]
MFGASKLTRRLSACVVLTTLFFVLPMLGQDEQSGKTVKTLNLIARDGKGNLVADMTAGDIEILDNGVKQQITQFKTPSEVAVGPRLVTIVFGGLSNEGRQYSKAAARDFLRAELGKNVRASVFVIDRRLYVQQLFTDDVKELEDAIDLAASGSFERYKKRSEDLE